jgi:hypothetical protein
VDVRNAAWAKGAAWLMEQDIPNTYARALRVIALSIGARIEDRYLKILNDDCRDLIRGIRANGGWRYNVDYRKAGGAADSDNSCSQYVALALREASYARVEIGKEVWETLEKYWRTKQCNDGGWDYGNQSVNAAGAITPGGATGYGSMSAAGLASSYIVYDMLLSRQRGDRPICRQQEYKPLIDGLRWFDKSFKAGENPGRGENRYFYYLYNIERIGATSGRKYFGKHDWYKEIATILLARQNDRGHIGHDFLDHCWGTIFLAKAQAQVVMNKLEYHDLDWDVHSRDVANFVQYMASDALHGFERPLNWQIVDLRRDVRELLDAPVLFVTGSKALTYDAEDIAKFRQFLLEGGTLVAQAACDSREFDGSFRMLCKRMLPEYELRPLEAEHPIYSAHARLRNVRLYGVDNGVRTCAILLPNDVSFYWHRRMTETRREAFDLGVNLVIYSMDRASFRTKADVAPLPAGEPAQKIAAALVRHPAGWNANPIVLDRLSDALALKAQIGLDVKDPVDLGKSKLDGIRLLWMSGYNKLDLPAEQQAALGEYIKKGGTLFVDAANGSADFYASVVQMLDKLLPTATRRQATRLDGVISGRFAVEGYDCSQIDCRRVLRIEKRTDRSPELTLYMLAGRVAAIASPYDISSGIEGQNPWACRGYEIDSSRRLGVNVALQVHEQVKALE